METWLAKIPGICTYRDREKRRETDKQLREHLASRLQKARSHLKRIALNLSKRNQLDPLDELDWLSSHMQQVADTIRHASYGYRGIFDLKFKIREEELDRLYSFDLSLLDEIDQINSEMKTLATQGDGDDCKEKIRAAQNRLYALEEKFHQRKDFMARPAS